MKFDPTREIKNLQAQNQQLLRKEIKALETEPKKIVEDYKQTYQNLQNLNNQLKKINADTFQRAAEPAKEASKKGFFKKIFKG